MKKRYESGIIDNIDLIDDDNKGDISVEKAENFIEKEEPIKDENVLQLKKEVRFQQVVKKITTSSGSENKLCDFKNHGKN